MIDVHTSQQVQVFRAFSPPALSFGPGYIAIIPMSRMKRRTLFRERPGDVVESRSVQPEQPGEGKVSVLPVYERPALMK